MATKVGSKVRALVTAQGMAQGAVYEVLAVERRVTFAGTVSTLLVRDDAGRELRIGNPHLVTEAVAS